MSAKTELSRRRTAWVASGQENLVTAVEASQLLTFWFFCVKAKERNELAVSQEFKALNFLLLFVSSGTSRPQRREQKVMQISLAERLSPCRSGTDDSKQIHANLPGK
jgi:hypothetical protein